MGITHSQSPGRWPVGKDLLMRDILLARIVELADVDAWEGTVRPALAFYLKVKPPRISALVKSLARGRLVRRKKVRLNGSGRLQIAFAPTNEGRITATRTIDRLKALRWNELEGDESDPKTG